MFSIANLNRSTGILQHETCEEKKVSVRQADLELEGLHKIENGRSGHEKPIPILRECTVGKVTNAGDLNFKVEILLRIIANKNVAQNIKDKIDD